MPESPHVGAFAIVPSNDLPAAIPFWERLGFARTGGDAGYVIMRGWGCEVHLTQAGDGPWQVPETTRVDPAGAPLIFEVRGLPKRADLAGPADAPGVSGADAAGAAAASMDNYRGVSVGNVIDCEGGYVVIGSYFAATAYDSSGKVVKEFKATDRHMANFIDVIRSRKTEDLYGPIGEGHISSALCHLGNISHQLGRAANPGETREKINGNAPLAEAYGRMVEHLGANGVDLAATPTTLGVPLVIDSAAERFKGEGAAAANALLTREYRKGFVVPHLA